jgi:uncharacterized protein (TIGR02266 family)
MSPNHRRHPRVRARGLAAHLRTEHGRAAAMVENISLGGLFVRTDKLQEVGTEFFVDVVSPGWKRALTLQARITSRVDALDSRVSKRPPGMGIQFLRVDEKQRERLRKLLAELGAPEGEDEVTLEVESLELGLDALELGTDEGAVPLEAQPQPIWQQVQMVEEAIEGSLREADLPPPGPVVLDDPPPAELKEMDSARLMVQLRGLVVQLADVQQQLIERDGAIQRLREELEAARAALARVVRKG